MKKGRSTYLFLDEKCLATLEGLRRLHRSDNSEGPPMKALPKKAGNEGLAEKVETKV
jgi:hypothetical protein